MGESTTKPKRFDVGEPVLDITLASSGTIFVVTSHGKVVGIDSSGWRAWERRWPASSLHRLTLRVANDGRPWVGYGHRLMEIDHDGSDRRAFDLTRDGSERLGSFLLAPEGFYVALYRPGSRRSLEPRVMKLDPSGSPLWSTRLPVGALGYQGVVEAGVHTAWETQPKRPWRPESWEPSRYGGSEPLVLSGDRLLASFFEFPRSGIGCCYGLDAESGSLLWVTEPAPTSTLAIAGPGHFYQGIQGYGAFETRLLGSDGAILRRWEVHGYLVIDEAGHVRCVEMENVLPSRMRYSLLLPMTETWPARSVT